MPDDPTATLLAAGPPGIPRGLVTWICSTISLDLIRQS